jgi:23S rRNA (guanosine2251-2'-O)-methyltransferase
VIVYGRQAVREALRGPRRVNRVWATDRAARALPLVDVPIERATDHQLAALAETNDHHGVCAEVAPYLYADVESMLEAPDALVVALDEVQDPQNLGAVCRVAECAGAAGVVVPERRAAEVTPAVCRASAGAVEHLAVARVRNLADWLGTAKKRRAWVYGAAARGRAGYQEPDYSGRVVLVLGSEGRGLRRRVADACDQVVSLPVR